MSSWWFSEPASGEGKVDPRNSFDNLVVVSNIFYVHLYLGKVSILTNIFQMG